MLTLNAQHFKKNDTDPIMRTVWYEVLLTQNIYTLFTYVQQENEEI